MVYGRSKLANILFHTAEGARPAPGRDRGNANLPSIPEPSDPRFGDSSGGFAGGP